MKKRLIDTHAHTFDVTETRVVRLDADPAAVSGAVERLGLARTIVQAIEALGLADRLALAPTRLESGNDEHVYGMAGRLDGVPAESVDPHDVGAFDRPGYVKVIWDVRVEAEGETGTILSSTTRVVSTDDSSRERLRAAWGIRLRLYPGCSVAPGWPHWRRSFGSIGRRAQAVRSR